MRFDPGKHRRRSIRLKQYDYTQTGAYFVTACTQNRECFFGEIVDGVMRLAVKLRKGGEYEKPLSRALCGGLFLWSGGR